MILVAAELDKRGWLLAKPPQSWHPLSYYLAVSDPLLLE